jgi:hypothetical protein
MRYREMRLPCDTEVTVHLGGEARRARFVNISSTGARMEGLGRLPREAPVMLSYLANRITARVVWSNELQCGLRFMTPLSGPEVNAFRGVAGGRTSGWNTLGAQTFRELT